MRVGESQPKQLREEREMTEISDHREAFKITAYYNMALDGGLIRRDEPGVVDPVRSKLRRQVPVPDERMERRPRSLGCAVFSSDSSAAVWHRSFNLCCLPLTWRTILGSRRTLRRSRAALNLGFSSCCLRL